MEMILLKFLPQLKKQKLRMKRPTIIEVKTVIGYGSPNRSGKSDSHGMPLGKEEIKLTKAAYKWTFEEISMFQKKYMRHLKKHLQRWSRKGKCLERRFQEYKNELSRVAKQFKASD